MPSYLFIIKKKKRRLSFSFHELKNWLRAFDLHDNFRAWTWYDTISPRPLYMGDTLLVKSVCHQQGSAMNYSPFIHSLALSIWRQDFCVYYSNPSLFHITYLRPTKELKFSYVSLDYFVRWLEFTSSFLHL